MTVTITAADYGQAGGVTETLPAGFAYVSSGLSASQVNESGQNVRFTLQGDTSFTYTVTASSTAGSPMTSPALSGTSSVTTTAWAAIPASRWRLPVHQVHQLPAPPEHQPGDGGPRRNCDGDHQAADYGQAGGVTETLPAGFAYVDSSLSDSQVNESGQNVRFTLQGDTSFTYTVTASSTPNS